VHMRETESVYICMFRLMLVACALGCMTAGMLGFTFQFKAVQVYSNESCSYCLIIKI